MVTNHAVMPTNKLDLNAPPSPCYCSARPGKRLLERNRSGISQSGLFCSENIALALSPGAAEFINTLSPGAAEFAMIPKQPIRASRSAEKLSAYFITQFPVPICPSNKVRRTDGNGELCEDVRMTVYTVGYYSVSVTRTRVKFVCAMLELTIVRRTEEGPASSTRSEIPII